MGDLDQVERLLNLAYLIQKTPGIKAKELAHLFGVTVRTVQRDIASLRKLGFEITSSTGAAGGFASKGSYTLKPLVFSGMEALALFVASRVLMEQKGFPYRDDLNAAMKKISQVIAEGDGELFQGLESRTSIAMQQFRDYEPWEKTFGMINRAILKQVTLEMVYESFSSQTTAPRRVNPYHLLFRDGRWYLIGYCQLREELRIFRVDRIQSLKSTNDPFQIPEEFSVSDFFKNSWKMGKGESVTCRIRFDAARAPLIRECRWHPTQTIEELADGGLILTVNVDGTWEIKKWILGWGSAAVCLEPEALREEIRNEIQVLEMKYVDG